MFHSITNLNRIMMII